MLTNAEKRRQFDSVDPVFMELEEDMPTATEFAKVRIPFFFFLDSVPLGSSAAADIWGTTL